MYVQGFLLKTAFNLWILPIQGTVLPIIAALFYYLTTVTGSSICQGESKQFINRGVPKQYCQVCNWRQYYRMKHCVKCNKCIHKYDHHCFLLNACIGEFNQKYYVGFLLFYLISEAVTAWLSFCALPVLVTMDSKGVESYALLYYVYVLEIFFAIAAIVLCATLLYRHTILILNNTTSWEEHRRHQITYMVVFQSQYPFSNGFYSNILITFRANRQNPIEWELAVGR